MKGNHSILSRLCINIYLVSIEVQSERFDRKRSLITSMFSVAMNPCGSETSQISVCHLHTCPTCIFANNPNIFTVLNSANP